MTPQEAIEQADRGRLLPFYLVAGEERLLRDRVVERLREAALIGGPPAFNEDRFTAGEINVATVLSAARTVPIMAHRRFVLVRGAERWDGEDGAAPFERLAEYASVPVESTCLVVVASKIDGRRKLFNIARKDGFLVACDPLDSRSLPVWIVEQCAAKGHNIAREAAEHLASLVGPELAPVGDALERLSLYVGAGAPIDEKAISECVTRVREADTWMLVDAVGARDLRRALATLADAYDPRERGLPLLGALAWSIRQLARYQAAIEAGSGPEAAARQAAVFHPARARALATKARATSPREVERWLLVLAQADTALKSSRRPPNSILEEMLTRLCRAAAGSARGPREARPERAI